MDENIEDEIKNLKRTGIFIYCRRGRTHNKHIIGEVVYLSDAYPEMLYRYKESLNSAPKELPEHNGFISGAKGIPCTLCENRRDYIMSPKAIKALGKHDPKYRKMLEDMLKDPDPKKKAKAEKILKWIDS